MSVWLTSMPFNDTKWWRKMILSPKFLGFTYKDIIKKKPSDPYQFLKLQWPTAHDILNCYLYLCDAFMVICVWSSPNALWPNSSPFVLSVQRTLLNLSRAAMFFFERRDFLLTTLPNKPHLFSLFVVFLTWTLTFNMQTEVCRVWDVTLVFFF